MPSLTVVAFCAAWCRTCDEFRATFEALARARPHADFVWLDVEDDAELLDDIDVENFPTLAVYRGGATLHFGVSLPHGPVVARLLDALEAGAGEASAPESVRSLPQRLARR